MAANYYRPGLGNVGSFQSSGIPWVSSSVTCPASGTTTEANRIDFPYVTKKLTVRNDGVPDIRVGFSDFGVRGMYGNKYYFTIGANDAPLELDFKVSRVYLYSDTGAVSEATVIAGLTSVDSDQLKTNWSGSDGIG